MYFLKKYSCLKITNKNQVKEEFNDYKSLLHNRLDIYFYITHILFLYDNQKSN